MKLNILLINLKECDSNRKIHWDLLPIPITTLPKVTKKIVIKSFKHDSLQLEWGFFFPFYWSTFCTPKLTRKWLKLACFHIMAHICRGKNIVQFGPSFITNRSFSQRSLVVMIGKRVPLVGETIITTTFRLVFSSTGNMEQPDICAEI